jgi:cysteine desulfurase
MESNRQACQQILDEALLALSALGAEVNGERARSVPNILNVSIPFVDSEATLVVLKDLVAISNGSACTSQTYTESHVLAAMGLPKERIRTAIRLSWGAEVSMPDWRAIIERLRAVSSQPLPATTAALAYD